MSQTTPAPVYPQPALAPKLKAFTASHWQIHAWGIGAITLYFMYEQFYLINNIHTVIFKIDPRWVFGIMAASRLVDGIIDPLLGHFSDNMHSRFGRRRPFLLAAGLLGALMASALFWMSPDWPWLGRIGYLAFSAIFLFIATGTYDMAHTALGYELSEEYADRSRIQAIRSVYWALMCIVGGYVVGWATAPQKTGDEWTSALPVCLTWIQDKLNWLLHTNWQWTGWSWFLYHLWEPIRPHVHFPNSVTGFRVISGIISVIMLIALVFPLFWSKEHYTKVNRTHVNLWQALKATLKCRPFVIILVINIAKNAGTLPRNLFFYIGVYYVCQGKFEDRLAEYSNVMGGRTAFIGFIWALLLWPLTKPLTRFIGKRAAFIVGAALGLLQAILTPFVARPGHVQDWLLLTLIFLPINHILGTAAAGLMPDICDLDEHAFGARREGLFTAVQSFANKMEIFVMTLFTGFFITWTGFNKDLHEQPKEVLDSMVFWGFMPLIAIAAIAFILSCFMPITHKMMVQVRAELDARRAAKIGVGAPEALGGFPVEPAKPKA